MDRSKHIDSREKTFVTAALVLLVLPLIVLFGVIALGLTTYADVFAGFSDVFSGNASWPIVALFVCWAFAVVITLATIALRFGRRSA